MAAIHFRLCEKAKAEANFSAIGQFMKTSALLQQLAASKEIAFLNIDAFPVSLAFFPHPTGHTAQEVSDTTNLSA